MRLSLFCLIILILNGCCGGAKCDCVGYWYDAIGFQFVKLPSEGGFATSQIDTIHLIRLDTSNLALDSLELYRDTMNNGAEEFITFDSTRYLLMFGSWMGIYSNDNKVNFAENNFQIRLLDGTHFDITDIKIETNVDKVNKCCECPKNTKKTLKVNGVEYDLTGKAELGEIAIDLKQ